MEYFKVTWKIDDFITSKFHYLELDDERYQKRIVDVFTDNSMGYADEICETSNTFLSDEPMPTIEESKDNNLYDISLWQVSEISKQEFEDMWCKAKKYVIEHNIKINFIRNINQQ